MSIHPIAELASAQQLSPELLWPLLLAPAGVLIAWALGALRTGSVEGPARSDATEPLGRLWAVTFLGFFTWVFVPALYAQVVYPSPPVPATRTSAATTRAATRPSSDFPPAEKLRMYMLGQVCAIVALLVANRATSPTGLQQIGLTARSVGRGVLYGLLGALSAVPLTIAASAFVQILLQLLQCPAPQDHELIQVFRSASPDVRRMVVVSAALLAPLFEELFFRGHLQTALVATLASIRGSTSLDVVEPDRLQPAALPAAGIRWLAIAIVSALFASVHGMNWMFAPLYLLSLCLGYAYERTGKMWVPMTMHASFNILSLAMAMYSL